MSNGTASAGDPIAGGSAAARITSADGVSSSTSTAAQRRSPWLTVISAPANATRWMTSTSKLTRPSESTARVKMAWAERTRWPGSSFEAATTAWARSWLP